MSSITTTPHASEAGNWYLPTGEQVTTVLDSTGKKQIKPDIRHARKMGLLPGVTSIIRCASAPGLDMWKQKQAIMAALTLPRQIAEPEDAWLARVVKDAGETAAKAAEEGTRIHAAIQAYYQGGVVPNAYTWHVDGVRALLGSIAAGRSWLSELGVASVEHGYGTKSDIHANDYVLDFKGKDGDLASLQGEKAWDTHWMQLAATRRLLALHQSAKPDAKCGIVYVSRTHPGAAWLVPVAEDLLEKGLKMFDALKAYWQAKNSYYPNN
jgi:hypothetical protein